MLLRRHLQQVIAFCHFGLKQSVLVSCSLSDNRTSDRMLHVHKSPCHVRSLTVIRWLISENVCGIDEQCTCTLRYGFDIKGH